MSPLVHPRGDRRTDASRECAELVVQQYRLRPHHHHGDAGGVAVVFVGDAKLIEILPCLFYLRGVQACKLLPTCPR